MAIFLSKVEYVHFIKNGETDKLDNTTIGMSEEDARKKLGDTYKRTQGRISVCAMDSNAASTLLVKQEQVAKYQWMLNSSPVVVDMDCQQVTVQPYDAGGKTLATKATVVFTPSKETLEDALIRDGYKPVQKAAAVAAGAPQPVAQTVPM